MHQQPNDRSCANEAIGGNHFGPQMIYMAAVDDVRELLMQIRLCCIDHAPQATAAVGSEASWFKIHEMGLMSNSPDYFGNREEAFSCGSRPLLIHLQRSSTITAVITHLRSRTSLLASTSFVRRP